MTDPDLLDDFYLAELVNRVISISFSCPYTMIVDTADPDYNYCPKGSKCPLIIDNKCPFLKDIEITKTSFYEFILPKFKGRKRNHDYYEELGEAV